MANNARGMSNDEEELGGERPRQRRGGGRPVGGSSGGRRPPQQTGGPSQSYQGRGRFGRRRVCLFCANKNAKINWKDPDHLRRFVADNGSIYPRRKSGLCAKHQRGIAVAIKRARHLALLPYTTEHIRIMGRS